MTQLAHLIAKLAKVNWRILLEPLIGWAIKAHEAGLNGGPQSRFGFRFTNLPTIGKTVHSCIEKLHCINRFRIERAPLKHVSKRVEAECRLPEG